MYLNFLSSLDASVSGVRGGQSINSSFRTVSLSRSVSSIPGPVSQSTRCKGSDRINLTRNKDEAKSGARTFRASGRPAINFKKSAGAGKAAETLSKLLRQISGLAEREQ